MSSSHQPSLRPGYSAPGSRQPSPRPSSANVAGSPERSHSMASSCQPSPRPGCYAPGSQQPSPQPSNGTSAASSRQPSPRGGFQSCGEPRLDELWGQSVLAGQLWDDIVRCLRDHEREEYSQKQRHREAMGDTRKAIAKLIEELAGQRSSFVSAVAAAAWPSPQGKQACHNHAVMLD